MCGATPNNKAIKTLMSFNDFLISNWCSNYSCFLLLGVHEYIRPIYIQKCYALSDANVLTFGGVINKKYIFTYH
jgi:hypothetical protein